MNKYKFFTLTVVSLVIFLLLGFDCSNDEEDSLVSPEESEFVGDWEWILTEFRGYEGFDTTYSTGQTAIMNVYSDFTFRRVETRMEENPMTGVREEETHTSTGSWQIQDSLLTVNMPDEDRMELVIYFQTDKFVVKYDDSLWISRDRHFGIMKETYIRQ